MSASIPIDVLSAAGNCIRQAMAADPTGSALPPVSDTLISQTVDAWRAANPVPAGGASLLDKAGALLRTIIKDLYEPFRSDLSNGRINAPCVTDAGLRLSAVAAMPATPTLFLIEEYRVTSFLGRYGIGRTLNTMTLLPGEETTIRLKTWRNTATTRTDTASVVDSEDVTVSTKFADQLSQEASDTSSRQASTTWNVAASASATWGFGSAEVSGGAASETHTARESFARTASEQVRENAREARSQRKTEVTTSTTTTETVGEEDSVERLVKNVNLRRTLNFLFRELNQEYIVRLHLTGVRFAHATPGRQGTWTEYPLSDLPTLLDRLIVPASRQQVAADLLGTVATIHNHALRPVHPLELLTMRPSGAVAVTELVPGAKGLNPADMPLKSSARWVRFKPGPLAPKTSGSTGGVIPGHPVDGVLLSEQSIVMPTGAIVVEAALGDRDALDAYGLRAQDAQLVASEAANGRELLVNEALGRLEGEERICAYAEATFGRDGSQREHAVDATQESA